MDKNGSETIAGGTETAQGKQTLLLTVAEAARLLRIRPDTLYHWVSQGRIPCVRLSARCLRFKQDELERWVATFAVKMRKSVESIESNHG